MCVTYHLSRRAPSTPSPAHKPSALAGETHPARSGLLTESNTLGPDSAVALALPPSFSHTPLSSGYQNGKTAFHILRMHIKTLCFSTAFDDQLTFSMRDVTD